MIGTGLLLIKLPDSQSCPSAESVLLKRNFRCARSSTTSAVQRVHQLRKWPSRRSRVPCTSVDARRYAKSAAQSAEQRPGSVRQSLRVAGQVCTGRLTVEDATRTTVPLRRTPVDQQIHHRRGRMSVRDNPTRTNNAVESFHAFTMHHTLFSNI